MNKKTVKTIIAVLMLLTVCLYFVSGTYARYTSSVTGKANVTVAKWAVKFTDGANELKENFNLTFTVDTNNNVVAGKIAPGTTATAKVVVDLTGTEVAVKCIADITEDALADVFGTSNVAVTTETKVGNNVNTNGIIALPNGQAFTADNGQVEVTVKLTWTDENTTAANTSDTKVGIDGKTLELPVTITLEQNV